MLSLQTLRFIMSQRFLSQSLQILTPDLVTVLAKLTIMIRSTVSLEFDAIQVCATGNVCKLETALPAWFQAHLCTTFPNEHFAETIGCLGALAISIVFNGWLCPIWMTLHFIATVRIYVKIEKNELKYVPIIFEEVD